MENNRREGRENSSQKKLYRAPSLGWIVVKKQRVESGVERLPGISGVV